MIVTNVVVTKTKLLFGMCNCTVDSDFGMGNFHLCRGICTCIDMPMCNCILFVIRKILCIWHTTCILSFTHAIHILTSAKALLSPVTYLFFGVLEVDFIDRGAYL